MKNERFYRNFPPSSELLTSEHSESPRNNLMQKATLRNKSPIEGEGDEIGYSVMARRKKYAGTTSPEAFFNQANKLIQPNQQNGLRKTGYLTKASELASKSLQKSLTSQPKSPLNRNLLSNKFGSNSSVLRGEVESDSSFRGQRVNNGSRSNSRDPHFNERLSQGFSQNELKIQRDFRNDENVYQSNEREQYSSAPKTAKKDDLNNPNVNNLSMARIEEVFDRLKREKEEFYHTLREQAKKVADLNPQNNPYLVSKAKGLGVAEVDEALSEKFHSLKRNNLALKTEFDELIQKQKQYFNVGSSASLPENVKKPNIKENKVRVSPVRRASDNSAKKSAEKEKRSERPLEDEIEMTRLRNEVLGVRNSMAEMEKEFITMRMELKETQDNLFRVTLEKEKQEIKLHEALEETITDKNKIESHISALTDQLKDLHSIIQNRLRELHEAQKTLGKGKDQPKSEKVKVLEGQMKKQQEANKDLIQFLNQILGQNNVEVGNGNGEVVEITDYETSESRESSDKDDSKVKEQLEKLKEEIVRLDKLVQEKNEENLIREEENKQLEEVIEITRKGLDEAKEQNQKIEELVFELEEENKRMENELREANEGLKKFKEENHEFQEKVNYLSEGRENIDEELKKLQSEYSKQLEEKNLEIEQLKKSVEESVSKEEKEGSNERVLELEKQINDFLNKT